VNITIIEVGLALMVITEEQVIKTMGKEEVITVMGNKDRTIEEMITAPIVMGLTVIVINKVLGLTVITEKAEVILVITLALTIKMGKEEVMIVVQTMVLATIAITTLNAQTTTKIKTVLSVQIVDITKIVVNAHHIIKVMANKDKVVETTIVPVVMGLTVIATNKVLVLTIITEKEEVIVITTLLVITTVLTIIVSTTINQTITLTPMLKIRIAKLKLNSLLKTTLKLTWFFLT